MGIFCKICVVNPPNNVFIPGNFVTGTIDYSFDSNTVVKRIQLSLKGSGYLETSEHRDGKESTTTTTEKYVDIQTSVLNEYGKEQFVNQHYKTPFNFRLPENIPGSLKYLKEIGIKLKCVIAYYIKIKFEISGFLKFDKKFEKEIKVVPVLTPKLSMEPVIYGERKQFFQPFKTNKGILHLKACIKCSVLEPGATVEIAYELQNNTNKTIEAIETKLVSIYKFYYSEKSHIKKLVNIQNTDSKTTAVKIGETSESTLEIEIPSDLYCIDDSKLVSREYVVTMTVCVPVPHKNMQLDIPIQVGKTIIDTKSESEKNITEQESPPSYWEAMNVCDDKSTSSDDVFFPDGKK
ncbi:unnamed protein product [Diatraea saccharalis]|uniref:Arrestin C-terminal-like domain-containing protein n=1 Tax=Diatraea saccharalis TaxID=40085 RepID=A0A9P0C8H5_9NEOP|nr:unnamed protein product [Diatraea saccharalis]